MLSVCLWNIFSIWHTEFSQSSYKFVIYLSIMQLGFYRMQARVVIPTPFQILPSKLSIVLWPWQLKLHSKKFNIRNKTGNWKWEKKQVKQIIGVSIWRACMQKLLNPLFIILHVFIDFNRSLPCASKSPISTSKMFLEIWREKNWYEIYVFMQTMLNPLANHSFSPKWLEWI